MIKNNATKLSPNSLFALLLISFLGLNSLNAPYNGARHCGPSGYWSIPLAFILVLPVFFLIISFTRRFPDKNLMEIAPLIIGRPLALVGNSLFLATLLGWSVLAIRDAANLILIYMLNRTPLWAIPLLFLVGVGYVAINGLSATGRLASFVLVPTVFFRLAMQILAFQGFEVSHLLPVFSAQPTNYLLAALDLTNAFLPLVFVLLIYPLFTTAKKLGPVMLSSSVFALIIFSLETLGVIGVLGAEVVLRYQWPNLALVHRISIPYLILEQVSPLFIIVWLVMFFIGTTFIFSLLAHGLKSQCPILKYRLTILILLLIAFIGGLLIPNAAITHRWFLTYRHWAILPATLYPLLIYFISLIKKIKGCPHEA